MKTVLITGGAGFIGSYLTDELLATGYKVRVYDNLWSQVHPKGEVPEYLSRDAEFIKGDVRDTVKLTKALRGVDMVVHFAAAVGVGQSMYDVVNYTHINNIGTATLMEVLANRKVERLLVASSMSIYGEGLCLDAAGNPVQGAERTLEQLKDGDWEVRDSRGIGLKAVPTPESKCPALTSIYALSKYDQERMCLMLGSAYGIPTVATRFFNVFGPRQSLSNPYTGVLAIFASRLLNNHAPMIFEDGKQARDFVAVQDVARACRLALEHPGAPGNVYNIGSGQKITIEQVAYAIAHVLGKNIEPEITQRYRVGDIRNCFADISKARNELGYKPMCDFTRALEDMAGWLENQEAQDHFEAATAELAARGLTL